MGRDPPGQRCGIGRVPADGHHCAAGRAALGTLPQPEEKPQRGYARLYAQEITGADQGCDFAFLKGQ